MEVLHRGGGRSIRKFQRLEFYSVYQPTGSPVNLQHCFLLGICECSLLDHNLDRNQRLLLHVEQRCCRSDRPVAMSPGGNENLSASLRMGAMGAHDIELNSASLRNWNTVMVECLCYVDKLLRRVVLE
jgi:hypothetical protein